MCLEKNCKAFFVVLLWGIAIILTINLILYSIPRKTQGAIILSSVDGEKKTLTYNGKVYDAFFLEKRFCGKIVFDGIEYVDQETVYKVQKDDRAYRTG